MPATPTVSHRVSAVPVRSVRVEVLSGPDKGKSVDTDGSRLSVGTAPGNDLVLTDETVSRYHLEAERRGDRIILSDQGSTNGTAIGSVLIERAAITPGTKVEVGKTILRFDDGSLRSVDLLDEDNIAGLLGRSPQMRALMATIDRVARSDVSVLITGPTGTGKEVVASAIHESSTRSSAPFVTVDCGSLSPTLVASELFGHERGSFTGAERQHVGAFERASGGTIFLDEIGDLPSNLQMALLGVLERRRFRRLGGTEDIAVDVRVVAATHRELRAEINEGRFRQDLYFRLAVVHLRVPSLAERPADVPLLAEHFLREAGYDGPVEQIITPSLMEQLTQHRWPGNARELRNWVEATLAMGQAREIEPASAQTSASAAQVGTDVFSMPLGEIYGKSWKDARGKVVHALEAVYLHELLARVQSNVSTAAREADMNRGYLIQMLKRHGLK